jgi:hypothetical protein
MNEYAKDVAEWLRKLASHVEDGKISGFEGLKWDGGDTCQGKLTLDEKVQFTRTPKAVEAPVAMEVREEKKS